MCSQFSKYFCSFYFIFVSKIHQSIITLQELVAELKQLLPALERLQSLTGSVCQMASEPRQQSLNHDLTKLQSHMTELESRLTDQVSSLEETDQKWQTYTEKLGEFSGALSDKLTTLDGLREGGHTPEEQFRLAKVRGQDLTGQKMSPVSSGLLFNCSLLFPVVIRVF